MRRSLLSATKVAPTLAALALLAAGCGPVGSAGVEDKDEPVDVDKGRQVFQTNCRVCHSLADANAAGVFGPDLDQLQPDAASVRKQIEEGGGGMPEGIIDGADADLVARYVAQVAGSGLPPEEQSGGRGDTKPSDP